MSGLLPHVPTQHELERLYFELAQVGATSVGKKRAWRYRPRTLEELIALAAEMLRYDARLLSILVQFLLAHWRSLHPIRLREWMHKMSAPQSLLVVLDFCRSATKDTELHHFIDYVRAGWSRVDPVERFFLDAERPASRIALRRVGRNLAPYQRWGFIGTEKPIVDPKTKRTVGRYDARTRRMIVRDLLDRSSEITLADYLEAVDHAISRQQALADLKNTPELRLTGHGRGAKWVRE